jgi:PKD repeat protein
MRKLTFLFSATLTFMAASGRVIAQSWPTVGGNNQKNGRSEITGPQSPTQHWSVTTPNLSLWGNSVYTFGDMFVQSRVVFAPSYTCRVEMRSLTTGELIWEQQVDPAAILYAVGFTEDAVYATDYGAGLLYALDVATGSVKWSVDSDMFPGNTGLVYACNGDPIEFGKRMNKETGAIVWSNNYPIPVGPDGGYVLVDKTYYHWTGYINSDKTLIAIDAETGLTKYTSQALPGDGDQENDLVAGPDGTIYITRDGGSLYSFKDDGTGFSQRWSRTPGPLVKAAGWDGSLYAVSPGSYDLIRLDPENGATIDSVQSPVNVQYGYVSIGADSTVYVATGEVSGRYLALTPDLSLVKWEIAVPYNYYSGPALGKDGVLVTVGSGTAMTAYRTDASIKPVVDFRSESRLIVAGSDATFFDQSSFNPDSWEWLFPGSSVPYSKEQDPSGITYPIPGVYEVTLVASNAVGTDTLTKSCYIEVQSSTEVNEPSEPASARLVASPGYPNPFNAQTTLRFVLNHPSVVTITIHDVLGREVANLMNEKKDHGEHTVKWNAEGQPSGVYYYHISTESESVTGKVSLIR